VRAALSALLLLLLLATPAHGTTIEYARPVDVAPQADDIGAGYVTPVVQRPQPRAAWHEWADLGAYVGVIGLTAWLVHTRRRRLALMCVSAASVAYFGFYRQGCICPIGSIQNVALALRDSHYAVPLTVVLLFLTPLIAAVLWGRVFCGGACPLGAIQELLLLRPVTVPRRVEWALGWLRWVYLALAVWFAIRPAAVRDFIICRFDPFIGLYRFSGPTYMLLIGGGLLLLGLFVGRPYCRYLCPYGALLGLVARVAWRRVQITPDKELDCGLCTAACPYGAIEQMRAVPAACVACARCFESCPRERVRTTGGVAPAPTPPTT
jgi:Pyruvate/2-oxoacid:ferredoxin oxidoreductase delta subunit